MELCFIYAPSKKIMTHYPQKIRQQIVLTLEHRICEGVMAVVSIRRSLSDGESAR